MAEETVWVKRVGPVLLYAVTAWLAVAFIGYGIALMGYEAKTENQGATVHQTNVVSRSAWGLGYIGDVCFSTRHNQRYCVPQHHIIKGPGRISNIYWALKPGSSIFMKAFAGHPAEIIVTHPDGTTMGLMDFNYAHEQILKDMQKGRGGLGFILFGLVLLPGVFSFRRFGWAWIKGRLSGLRRARSATP